MCTSLLLKKYCSSLFLKVVKSNLKSDAKTGTGFYLYNFIFSLSQALSVSEMTKTDICNTLVPIWHTKAVTTEEALIRLNLCLKYVADQVQMLIYRQTQKRMLYQCIPLCYTKVIVYHTSKKTLNIYNGVFFVFLDRKRIFSS